MEFTQTPDTRPGPYYVSARDNGKTFIMAGPYETHAEALAKVDEALQIANEHDGRAWFMSWGTVRVGGSERIGTLTKRGLI